MSFTLAFPGHKDAEPHVGLLDEEDVYAVVKKEVQQSVEDMGSDGYDLIWPDGVPQDLESWQAWFDQHDDTAQEALTMEAHQRGIERATTIHATSIYAELFVGLRTDKTAYATLPGGTKISLTEEDDD